MKRVGIQFAALAASLMVSLPAWAEEAAHEGGSKSLPQLDVTLYPGVVFWMVASFVIFFVMMKKVGVPGIQETITKRRSILDSDLDAARKASEEADAVIKAHEEELQSARRKAQETVGGIVMQTAKEAAEEQEKQETDLHHRMTVAHENLAKAKQDAMRETQHFVNDLVNEVVAKAMQSGIEAKTSGARN